MQPLPFASSFEASKKRLRRALDLGWTSDSWAQDFPPDRLIGVSFAALSQSQQEAVGQLGLLEEEWNELFVECFSGSESANDEDL